MASSSSVPSSLSLITSTPPLPPLPSHNQTLTVKLNSSNYLVWKTQLLHVATANDIQHLLDSSSTPSSQFLDALSSQANPEYSVWQRYNSLLMSWIFPSLSEDLLPHMIAFSMASDIWAALERNFASSSLARITDLRSRLHPLSKDRLSASSYFKNLTSLCNALVAIGEPVSHRDKIIYFLNGLGGEYNSFVTSISSITNCTDQPSLEEIQSLLQSFDFHLERQNSVISLSLPTKMQAHFTS